MVSYVCCLLRIEENKETKVKKNIKNISAYFQARRNEKISGGGLRVYKQMLANLVGWLGRWFDWNRLKCLEIRNNVEVGYASS